MILMIRLLFYFLRDWFSYFTFTEPVLTDMGIAKQGEAITHVDSVDFPHQFWWQVIFPGHDV